MYQVRQAYLESEILQADPLRLVQLLYRGAIEAVGKARLHLQRGEIKARSAQITKAMDILAELASSMDLERGGDLAKNLVMLYDYMIAQLQTANFQQVEGPLVEVEKLLTTLAEAWEQIAPQTLPGSSMELAACASGEEAGYSPRSFVY
ncbi:MAG: flagellar export chaperone FliS [Bryobacterales bacterium]|nr:flagellar export chaperone FliS [Bryobacterales bacterium]